jgi:hypothetical protein
LCSGGWAGFDRAFAPRFEKTIDPKDMDRQVFVGKDTKPLRGLADLPSHAILDRGRLVELWEYDTSTTSITWWLAFPKKDNALRDAVARTELCTRTARRWPGLSA